MDTVPAIPANKVHWPNVGSNVVPASQIEIMSLDARRFKTTLET